MFAKVFEQIFDSSIAVDWQVRHVFEDFLKLAKKSGSVWVVDMTPDSIARRTGVPLDIVERAIKVLEAPDPDSRTPDQDGKRLIRLDEHRDWGWIIVNYQKYREIASREMVRMAETERKQKYRTRFSPTPPLSVQKQSTEAEAERSQVCPGQVGTNGTKPALNEMLDYGKEIGLSQTESTKCFDYYQSNGWKVGKNPMRDWKASMRNWSRNVTDNATRQHSTPARHDRNATTLNNPANYAGAAEKSQAKTGNLPGLQNL